MPFLYRANKHVIQLDRTQVKVMGELRDVMIRIATHPKFVQVIDIIVVDIPEAYGLLLSRDWSEKLNGYFSTDWAHLWLPLKGYKNMIRIDRERYLKHTVTDLETLNEPSSTDFPCWEIIPVIPTSETFLLSYRCPPLSKL
jgi:hypothetical protein